MEYIEGYDLNGLQKKYGMLSFEYSVKVIKPILNGLKYAHGKGIIHRDLKPSNVVFSTKEKIFKIIDFGVSLSHKAASTRLHLWNIYHSCNLSILDFPAIRDQ